MADMQTYLLWRGDLPFSQVPPGPVDALIFTTLAYVRYGEGVPGDGSAPVSLKDAADWVLAAPDRERRCRVRQDLEVLEAAARSARFGGVELCFYRSVFAPEEEAQFAAVTFLLGDGTAFLAFRGTDSTLVGWKEDFNMSFLERVPAQLLAAEYTRDVAQALPMPLRLGGHSKGGNLAVYAAAKSAPEVRSRIREVYNNDGPGFMDAMMRDPGYLEMVPRVRTFVPQSSVIGMLLEHEEPYTIVRSSQMGILQHDPHSWEIQGGDFVRMETLTANSRFLNRTLKDWLAGMTPEQRNTFFDSLFDVLAAGDASRTREIMRPQNLLAYFRALRGDENLRRILGTELSGLLQAARNAQSPGEKESGDTRPSGGGTDGLS